MKLLLLAVVLCVAQCQANAYRRKKLGFPTEPQFPGLSSGPGNGEIFPDYTNGNILRHQTNILTGRLVVRAGELLSFVTEKLQHLKDIFDENGWTTLSDYTAKWIEYFSRYQNDAEVDNAETYKNDYLRNL